MDVEEPTLMSDETNFLCEICLDDNKSENASFYCAECQQKFCNHCSKSHSSQKAFQQHMLIDVSEMPKSEINFDSSSEELCEPCLSEKESNPAEMYCDDCEEKLCGNCSWHHGKMKITKLHLRITIAEFKERKRHLHVKCAPCLQNDEESEAEEYCKTCEEDLCLECTKMHKRFKATRNHELIKVQDRQSEEKVAIPNDARLCEPCKQSGKENMASEICKECEEFLCVKCAETHKVQKATKHHTLLRADDVPTVNCEPCLERGETVVASRLCTECKEALCSPCSEMHSIQKATRNHKLGEVPLTIHVRHVCSPCKGSGKEVLAIQYCSECEEYYCSRCAEMHGGQKATRAHVLIAAAEMKENNLDSDEISNDEQPDEQRANLPTVSELPKEGGEVDIVPGIPIPMAIQSDCIKLSWQRPKDLQGDEAEYQIRYKESTNPKWKFYSENPDRACVEIKGLKSDCSYVFQVRSIIGGDEGPYGPESKEITTQSSLASQLLGFTKKVKDGNPSIYHLLSTENMRARNIGAKTRKFELGKPPTFKVEEKTILLVGAAGSGKSTLVDGIINYVAGVNWKDPYRFTLVDLEKEEMNKNQAVSQTEWMTCYTINPEEGSRLSYRLNIIDTPGFGDTRGLERDQQIVDQLRELFSSAGDKGVVFIDAVCFVMKAPDARPTSVQKYIFMSILSLFGKDIEENICTLITFADGKKPPVLSAMEEAELPVKFWYVFNNSGLFEDNDDNTSSLAPMFWEMGNDSFYKFFKSIDKMSTKMSTKSLQQTKQVLEKRKQLEVTILSLQPQVDAGLNKLHQLNQEIDILKKHEREIADNKDFEYEVDETIPKKTELQKGIHVTNCLHCKLTCHDNCAFANDEDKRRCCVMDGDGNCTVCDSRCSWKQHHNTPYVFTFVTKKVKKTYAEKIYQKAGEKKVTHVQVVERMKMDLNNLKECVQDMMHDVNECNNTLKQIALHPNPLSMVEHIDLMIESEKMEKKDGFLERIQVLEGYRQRAEIHKNVDKFHKGFASANKKGNPSTNEEREKKKGSWGTLVDLFK